MEIQHFSHPDHPLKLVDSIEENAHIIRLVKSIRASKVPNCSCCCEEMSFPGYACEYIRKTRFPGYAFDDKPKHRILGYDYEEKCKFYLHKSCAELAQNISHPLHPHPLILLSVIPGSRTDNLNGIICDGCRNLYNKGFTYYCTWSCGFNLDLKCASKVQDHEELLQQQTFNKELTLYHFCHKHALNFCNLRDSYYKPCCCCNKVIRGSAYCCLQCHFFIHESCTEIPKQVQHTFHPQHIILTQAMDYDAFMTRCDACRSSINGVRISCNMCKFHLHVSCANQNRWASPLKHKCHEHNMFYFLDNFTTDNFTSVNSHHFKCNKCYERCFKKSFYRCVKCDFNLHLECIPIPSVVTVTQNHHHPLTLIDSVKEDNPLIQYLMDSNDELDHSMDYYCDVCETPGNPKHHAYCCKECIYIAHVECIISQECPPRSKDYTEKETDDEAEQDNNIGDKADESEKKSNEVQETGTEDEQEIDIEDCSLAQISFKT